MPRLERGMAIALEAVFMGGFKHLNRVSFAPVNTASK